jgi:hypothetical protein
LKALLKMSLRSAVVLMKLSGKKQNFRS